MHLLSKENVWDNQRRRTVNCVHSSGKHTRYCHLYFRLCCLIFPPFEPITCYLFSQCNLALRILLSNKDQTPFNYSKSFNIFVLPCVIWRKKDFWIIPGILLLRKLFFAFGIHTKHCICGISKNVKNNFWTENFPEASFEKQKWKPIHFKDFPDSERQKASEENQCISGTMLLLAGLNSPKELQNRWGKLQMGTVDVKSRFCI